MSENAQESPPSPVSLPPMESLNIMAIDHGEKRIGVAIRPKDQTLVLPLAIVPALPLAQAQNRLRDMIRERKIDVVVVGLPLHERTEQAQKVRKFTRKLREGISGVRWRFVDESLTSQQAESDQRESEQELGISRREKGLDDRAAVLILESYLQTASQPSPAEETPEIREGENNG